MSSYCTYAQVSDRLSLVGLLYVIDDDDDNAADASEQDVVTEAIEDASSEIDSALCYWFELPISASNAANDWLKFNAINLTVERLCERKGMTPPVGFQQAAQRTREDLDKVRAGSIRIPNMTYPIDQTDIVERRKMGLPTYVNPK